MVKVETVIGILFIGCSLKYLHAAHLDATKVFNLNRILPQVHVGNNQTLSVAATEVAEVTLIKADVVIRNLTGVFLFKNGTVPNSTVSQPPLLPSNLFLRMLLSDVSFHKKRTPGSFIWKDIKTIVASISLIDTVYKQIKSPIWLRANIVSSFQTIPLFPAFSKRYFLSHKNFETYSLSLDWITTCSRNNVTSCIKAELAASKQIDQLLSNVNYSTLTIWLRKITRVNAVGLKKIIVGEDGETVINLSGTLGNSLGLNYSELKSSGSVIIPTLSVILLILIL